MILDELAAFARKRVAADQAKTPLADIKAQAKAMPKGDFRFEKALAGKDCAFICEVKKASPSKIYICVMIVAVHPTGWFLKYTGEFVSIFPRR